MGEFNRENVRQALEESIAEKGADYTYPRAGGCFYALNGHPSCIVGHVVNRIDPELFHKLIELDRDGGDTDWATMAERLGLDGDPFLTDALAAAQEAQDRGRPWGVALDRFEEGLKRNG